MWSHILYKEINLENEELTNKMNLVSIIVPVFQVEKYLDKCIQSIVNQTYHELEIILVDDGSTDRCPEMCDIWKRKDARIRVIHKKNGGLSDARNVGVYSAQGNYIAFVDSDDWIDFRFIEYLYAAIQETNADIAACDVRKVEDESGHQNIADIPFIAEISTPKEAINDILNDRRFRTVVWNKLYKREILKGEMFEVGRLHEDEFFSYRLYDKASSLAYIDLPLYNYRQRTGSIMTSFSLRHLDALDAYLGRIKLLERKYPDLAIKDKVNFCIACVNLYSKVSEEDKKKAEVWIQNCRNQIRFSREEFSRLTAKEKVYVIISKKRIIELTCAYQKLRKRNE